ncbi:MAG TPA: type I secretion C-terminal target domain-containing protein, partial [Micavibrio sp.]
YSGVDFNTGTLGFYYHFGQGDQRAAHIDDNAVDIALVWSNGTHTRIISGDIYHTTPANGANNLNPDLAQHVVSGVLDPANPTTLRVGFEDLPNLGDADYNDVTMDVSVEDRTIATPAFDDDDYLVGGAGNDTIYGGIGDDILVGGAGADRLYGEEGADIFVLDTDDGQVDTIYDFNRAQNDSINIHDLLQGYDPLSSAITDFVRLTQSGGNILLEVNATGQAQDSFVAAALIIGGVGGVNVDDLLASGHLVADHAAIA